MLSLTPVSAAPVSCKICGEPAPVYGTVDFNRNCKIDGGIRLPPCGTLVRYRRCGACGFLFTDAFDRWSQDEFKTHIYNGGYAAVDPEYAEARPRNNATAVLALFGAHKEGRRVLDYGGGNDTFCAHLRAAGFPLAVTYDPFVPEFAKPPRGKFDLITCFETLEHMPNPIAGIGDIVAYLDEPGLVLFSTTLQPADFEQHGMGWWYIGPRNGHISLFSRSALAKAWGRHGYRTGSFDDNMHVAFRTMPDFASHWAEA
jgi:hypothetical protein